MDYSPSSRRSSKKPTKSELYSTFVVHSDDDEEDEHDSNNTQPQKNPKNSNSSDIYATMLCKSDDDQNDDESLPPLLKRLPKDFGAAIDSDDESESISGTMIVKPNRRQTQSSYRIEESDEEEDDDEDGGGFGTFVVKSEERESESISGTFVRRTSGGSGGGMSTMSRAVASMQSAGEGFGIRKGRKGSATPNSSSQELEGGHSRHRTSKMSSGSIADSVTREDPSTKYELLHELGIIFFI